MEIGLVCSVLSGSYELLSMLGLPRDHQGITGGHGVLWVGTILNKFPNRNPCLFTILEILTVA